jgi:hypothetical protein
MHMLQYCQDKVVYALGRLKALGALTGLHGGEDRIDLWRVHLVMGYLHGYHPIARLVFFNQMPALAAELRRVLANVFGLMPTELERHLAHYEFNMLSNLSDLYEAEEAKNTREITT